MHVFYKKRDISAREWCEVCERFIMKVLSLAPQQVPLCRSRPTISKQHEAIRQPLNGKQANAQRKKNSSPANRLKPALCFLLIFSTAVRKLRVAKANLHCAKMWAQTNKNKWEFSRRLKDKFPLCCQFNQVEA